MAGKLTHVGATRGLDAATGRATVNSRTHYLALLTSAPSASTTPATMAEATFTYTRPEVTFSAPAGTPRNTENSAELTIGPLNDANGSQTVSHWLVVSSASGTTGEAIAYGDWTLPRTPNEGDTLRIPVGDLDISID